MTRTWREKREAMQTQQTQKPAYIIMEATNRCYFYAIAEHAIGDKSMNVTEYSKWCHRLDSITVMGAFKEAIALGLNVDRTKWIDDKDRTNPVLFYLGD